MQEAEHEKEEYTLINDIIGEYDFQIPFECMLYKIDKTEQAEYFVEEKHSLEDEVINPVERK